MRLTKVEFDSPEGQKLWEMYKSAEVEIIDMLVTGAVGRRLDDLILNVGGVKSSEGVLVPNRLDFSDLAAMVSADPLEGTAIAASIPPGELLVRIYDDNFLLRTLLPLPAELIALRHGFPRDHSSSLTVGESAGHSSPANNTSRNAPCRCGSGRKFKHCCAC